MRIGILLITLSLPAWFWSCFNGNKVASAPKETISVTNQEKPSFYDLKAMSLDGETIDMSKYKGKKVIILNVASKCGYTPQYADWQKFYESNKDQVEVLGFPCNQFLGQEPGSSDEIATFCQKNYGVTFQMFDKVDVKGDQQHAIYQWLTDPSKNGWNSEVPSWNFCKYLINEEGKLTHFFGSKIKPDNQEFIAAYK
ncbi:MAG TPA: glutathione peroxidase [Saprospiraceae bacterium]|jgi:glutathione peroxidase|nr:glutathione peroxidase [Saprospiraceae bacterium]